MKTERLLRLRNLILIPLFLILGSTAFALVEIGDTDLQALIDSGVQTTVPEGETYILILPDGKKIKLIAGTIFTVVDDKGKIKILRGDRSGPRPPYERMKEFPRKIVQENLNDISPS